MHSTGLSPESRDDKPTPLRVRDAPPRMQRLPIQHPEYRYPVSRNPYWAKVRDFPGRIFSDNDTEVHPGKWREQFPVLKNPADRTALASSDASASAKKPIHVEIGCNGGHVILEWATRDPQGCYLGLDWKFKQIHRGAEKANKRGLTNLIFLRSHAERIDYVFAPGEIDYLYLYFPDPWAKKSQLKNRYITANRLEGLAKLVRKGGTFHIKTDHAGYFEWMEDALAELQKRTSNDCPWKIVARSADLHAEHPEPTKLEIPEVTLFEKIFIKREIKINSLKLERV